jgi:hypothetical protein
MALILGMSLPAFTALHVALSLIAIAAGTLALLRPDASTKAASLTALFLATTLAASVTGLLFASLRLRLGLGHVLGVMSLVVLVPTLLALYRYRLAGAWRWIYVAGATIVLYLNAFIGVMQAFGKIGFLQALPSTAFASPLLLAHLLLLAVCLWLGLHALTILQPGGAGPRPARPQPTGTLRVVDRWGN